MEGLKSSIEKGEAPEGQERREVKYREIAELRTPVRKILEQLSGYIDRGKYGLIIGDDASGRIPTLIFDRVLKALYRENKFIAPRTIFFAGGSALGEGHNQEKKNEMANYLHGALVEDNKKIGIGKETRRALLVTDTIMTGKSLQNVAEVLQKEGVVFDVACVGLLHSSQKSDIERKLGGRIFFGGTREPAIYKQHRFSGVKKEIKDAFLKNIFVKPIKTSDPVLFEEEDVGDTMREARKDVQLVADEIIEWYKTKSKAQDV